MNGYQRAVHENKKPFKCDICLKSFGGTSTLYGHQRTVHENQKPIKCDICPKSFGSKVNICEMSRKFWKKRYLRAILTVSSV